MGKSRDGVPSLGKAKGRSGGKRGAERETWEIGGDGTVPV